MQLCRACVHPHEALLGTVATFSSRCAPSVRLNLLDELPCGSLAQQLALPLRCHSNAATITILLFRLSPAWPSTSWGIHALQPLYPTPQRIRATTFIQPRAQLAWARQEPQTPLNGLKIAKVPYRPFSPAWTGHTVLRSFESWRV